MHWQAEATNPFNWTAAGVVVSLLVGAGGVIVAGLALRAKTRDTAQGDAEWRGTVNALLERIRSDLDEVRQIVFARFGVPLLASRSPLRLTKLGRTVSVEIDASAWVDRVAGSLEASIEGKDAYEIQTFCFEYVEDTDQYSDEEQRSIRNTAFQRGLRASDVRSVLAIELRDQLLEKVGLEAPRAPDED